MHNIIDFVHIKW